MVDVKKVAVAGGIIGTVIGSGFCVAKALGIGFKPALTFEAPSKCNYCEELMLKGTFKKGWKPLPTVRVTLYTRALGITVPIGEVITTSDGSYILSGVPGIDTHQTEYVGFDFSFWAEATYNGTLYKSPERLTTLYYDSCTGPCDSTIPPALKEAIQKQMIKRGE